MHGRLDLRILFVCPQTDAELGSTLSIVVAVGPAGNDYLGDTTPALVSDTQTPFACLVLVINREIPLTPEPPNNCLHRHDAH